MPIFAILLPATIVVELVGVLILQGCRRAQEKQRENVVSDASMESSHFRVELQQQPQQQEQQPPPQPHLMYPHPQQVYQQDPYVSLPQIKEDAPFYQNGHQAMALQHHHHQQMHQHQQRQLLLPQHHQQEFVRH